MPDPVIVACATALPAHTAVLRLSGAEAAAVAQRAGLPCTAERAIHVGHWALAGGRCPLRIWRFVAPRSFTGEDVVEIAVPGSQALVDLAIEALITAGAEAAGRGAFARRALANGRLSMDRAEAILAVAQAGDAAAARAAIIRLRGRLGQDLEPLRARLIHVRALVEAGLDFAGEDGITSFDPRVLAEELRAMRTVLARWQTGAATCTGEPLVALVGPANAGKSALFTRLSGASALVSPVAGTTRDVLEATWICGGRQARLIDTAGWLDHAEGLDASAVAAGRAAVQSAAVIIACSAPDAPLPDQVELDPARSLIIATKADLGVREARAVLAVSVSSGAGLDALSAIIAERLAGVSAAEPRHARSIDAAIAILDRLGSGLPDDVLLAEDLRRLAELLGEVIGATTADAVLDAIFGQFCIGK